MKTSNENENKLLNHSCVANRDLETNLSIIPLSDTLVPTIPWKAYQETLSPVSLWMKHLICGKPVGIICGKVSMNLECIIIKPKLSEEKIKYGRQIPSNLLKKLTIQKTPKGNYYLIYRCTDIEIDGSTKLALNGNNKAFIETRGEGAYFATDLYDSRTIRGRMDLESFDASIQNISKDEREFLFNWARSLSYNH